MADDLWPMFESAVTPLLGADDDPALWAAVVNAVYPDAQALCRLGTGHGRIATRLGRCSHWLRPHQTRWTADGGFAWPTGYVGRRFSREGLPEFDWFAQWAWSPESNRWARVYGGPVPGELCFRVAVPARSARHEQAAVHTVWRPGPPPRRRVPLVQFYGFRKRPQWTCTAYRGPGEWVYELASRGRDA